MIEFQVRKTLGTGAGAFTLDGGHRFPQGTILGILGRSGVGKTTLTMNLASLAAEEGRKPLIVDLDAQRSCYDWRVIRSAA